MLEHLKRKASGLINNRLHKTAHVLEVRYWETSTITEIDLHLPTAEMDNWNEVNYMKCKVDNFTYRDYTPAGWDAETQTCTLFIDTAHKGPGSIWAQNLKQGDQISYIGIASTKQTPVNTSAVICLGDESALGHMLALQQLTQPVTRLTGAITMESETNRNLFSEYFKSPITTVSKSDKFGHHSLTEWLLQQSYDLENTIFYLAGNNTMVMQMRKLLRNQGYGNNQIKAQGFWN
ncbi:SIP domain-containing protein [Mucilaginibacter sp. KACC 22063]|uniref:SIP domain-containing protein n=1 Tax=Mucilaginibacter sp. KACC 22063 TaxID=3025666 RepID=UPI0023658368|nr:SIP domain-containing protein [Mucilaginibacter sp. KACC 22063]WDF53737.1 SIP domain-containing protein [Mucilaginibacter sp. KACC 22063]